MGKRGISRVSTSKPSVHGRHTDFPSRVAELDEGADVVVEAMVEEVVSAQFAQTTPRCRSRMSCLRSITMSLVWSKAQSEKNSGQLYGENYPTVFALLGRKGMTACLGTCPINLQCLQASTSSAAAAQGSIHPANNLYRVQW